MWNPVVEQPDLVPHDSLGAYRQHRGTWSALWRHGDVELQIMGYGPVPSDAQVATWNFIRPKLDAVLKLALEALPPPPKPGGLAQLFGKKVNIDTQHPMLELGDNGAYEIQFHSDLVLDGDAMGPFIEMQGDRVVVAEWSC